MRLIFYRLCSPRLQCGKRLSDIMWHLMKRHFLFRRESVKMKEKKVSLPVLIICVLLTVILTAAIILCIVPNPLRGYLGGSDSLSKYYEIQNLINNNFVEEVSDEDLADGIALGAIYALSDKYSAYFTAEQYAEVLSGNQGIAAGIGVTVTQHPDNGYIYVIRVSTGSPADAAGIKAGDFITQINGSDVTELGFSAAVSAIKGETGTKCAITAERDGKAFTVEAVRGEYVETSVFSHMIGSLCYIQITDFNSATVSQFEQAVNDAVQNNADGLIFDVRGNGGGTLEAVEKMCDLLLPEGDIVSATYKNGKKSVLFTSDANEIDLPMAVLTDENTASAAELFAAAIRDYDKGKLIGTNTFGKGIMQRTYALSDGSAVRLTVAYFNPPSGVNFHGVGLSPDIEVELNEEEKTYYYMLTDETDPVIKAAVELLENS